MTTLPIPAGPLNKEIIDLAYTVLGVSDAMFGRTDEEYASAMTMLRAMMGEWPFDQLGFDTGDARVGSESGIEAKWLTAIGYSLATRIGSAAHHFRNVPGEYTVTVSSPVRFRYGERLLDAGTHTLVFIGPERVDRIVEPVD